MFSGTRLGAGLVRPRQRVIDAGDGLDTPFCAGGEDVFLRQVAVVMSVGVVKSTVERYCVPSRVSVASRPS